MTLQALTRSDTRYLFPHSSDRIVRGRGFDRDEVFDAALIQVLLQVAVCFVCLKQMA